MKKYVISFIHRGIVAAAGGPIILAVIYAILGHRGVIESITAGEAVKGILTSILLAFVAGGISMIYTVDRLQIAHATLIQMAVLYADYITIYLINGWIPANAAVIAIFTVSFIVLFMLIWTIVYLIIRHNIDKVNKKLTA